MDNSNLETLNLSSMTGVLTATLFCVEIVKRLLGRYAFFSKLPVFVYAIVISAALALLANKIPAGDSGKVLLEGQTWKIVWAAVIAAAGSSGFYTWLRNPESVSTANTMSGFWVILVPLMSISGCSSGPSLAEHVTVREGMDQTTRTIRKEHQDWSRMLVLDENGKDQRDKLPRLRPSDLDNRLKTHKEYEDLVAEDRKRDTETIPFKGLIELLGGQAK